MALEIESREEGRAAVFGRSFVMLSVATDMELTPLLERCLRVLKLIISENSGTCMGGVCPKWVDPKSEE